MMRLERLSSDSEKLLKQTNVVEISFNTSEILLNKISKEPPEAPLSIFEGMSPIFFLLIDALNFCFWNPDLKKTFRYHDRTGSVALGLRIKEILNGSPNLFDKLTSNCDDFVRDLLGPTEGTLLLIPERERILRDIGIFLKENDFDSLVEDYSGESVNDFASFLIEKLPYAFSDIVNYDSISLPFCKKLRLLLSDLEAFCGMTFSDRNNLLVFADYKLPYLFMHYGVINVRPDQMKHIIQGDIIPYGS